jgi:hypothetical protein
LGIGHPMWSTLCCRGAILNKILCYFLTKKLIFLALWTWNNILCNKNLEAPFDNSVWHVKMHLCVKYGHIIMNYFIDMTMTMAICIESHECLYMVVHFVKVLLQRFHNLYLSFFLATSTHKRIPCQMIVINDSLSRRIPEHPL